MPDRPLLDIPSPPGGWGPPWCNVAELAAVLPGDRWTLVGGLMAQLHGVHQGIGIVRPTNDVDIIVHVETTPGVVAETARALESIGYGLVTSIDERNTTAHRFRRSEDTVDVLTAGDDVVDVLIADHAPPRVVEPLRGRDMVAIEGGTQALRRTVDARLTIGTEGSTTISVPSAIGATILKAAAYRTDSRDTGRHLQDAALLLACIEDPFVERERFAGSDRSRIRTLARALPDGAREWRLLPETRRNDGQAALRILAADPPAT
ncbi:nucleotidyl transferase AbiEii/AbiGii toxin family protein [Isoptericola sp. b515]|uniref:nucleotidyl transferase AbiEii/AbiGii toxin family protein n=1 Tax=Isoptericola sp. b515 TaxID=3064652 RepID=UPI0027127787|nr:nucleotidyl transferase AbiEii/AbiGii toxin family protein [Isoptericola sp. b515]MDO8147233.1 nucleotidyl transferase AbiEii/AbiGii toxin family protein [Isoptericola sp. b515]